MNSKRIGPVLARRAAVVGVCTMAVLAAAPAAGQISLTPSKAERETREATPSALPPLKATSRRPPLWVSYETESEPARQVSAEEASDEARVLPNGPTAGGAAPYPNDCVKCARKRLR